MNEDWCSMVNSACPLPIRHVSWDDLALVLSGPEWAFTCTSPWRVVSGERLVAGWEDARAAATVAELESLQVVGCQVLTRLSAGDVRLVLSDGQALEVFVANSVDPWVLRLPDRPTIVPSPTDPGWFRAESH